MAVTLAQTAKLTKDPLRKGVIMNLLRYSTVLDLLPFENVDSLNSVAVRWTNLPDPTWRRINEEYVADEGDFEQVYESVYAFGGELEVDRVWAKVRGSMIVDPEVENMKMHNKAMALTFNDYFINGDHATDVDGIEGLRKRISNMPSRQSVRAGSGTSVADPTATMVIARYFMDKFDEAFVYANDGDVQAILCNLGMKLGLGRVIRYGIMGDASYSGGNLLDVTKDSYDRTVYTYRGVPLIDMGVKIDQSTEIIANGQTAEDDGTDATDMFFVPFNSEQGITGIQLDPIEVFDGKKDKSTADTTVIEWWVGLAGFGSYGPVRLHNIEEPTAWT